MKYNIVIIGIETCRKDALQCYNPSRNTPYIQQLADKSIIFDNFYTNASNTYQSLGCLFSGLYAHKSNISIKRNDELDKDLKLIDKTFFNNGYYVKINKFGEHNPLGNEITYTNSEGNIREPFFIFEGSPHLSARAPYDFTEYTIHSKDEKDIIESHARCIEKMDSVIHDYIKRYEKYNNTIIIILSDHGDKITKGEANHYNNIDNETVNIPLIIYYPNTLINQNKNRRIPYIFSMVDIFPTLLGMCGIEIENYDFDGKDLRDYIVNDIPFPNRSIQIGPTVGCKESKMISQNLITSEEKLVIKEHDYTRKHILTRMSDYKDREYVNKVMFQLERSNYFNDEWTIRSTTYNNLEHSKNNEYINNLIDFINIKHLNTLLDAGAGTGSLSIEISKTRPDIGIYAIDHCFSMLNQIPNTEKTKNIKKYVSDIEKMTFMDNESIDKIVCSMVIHSNFERIDKILDEFKRVLKPNGELIISEVVPMDNSKEIIDFNEYYFHKKEDRTIITENMINDTLSKNNFTPIESKEFILKNVSIKNWLLNSQVNRQTSSEIYDIFKNTLENNEIKNKINLRYKKGLTDNDDDIYRDWKFVFIKAIKQ